ncbi:MAG TPA: hypothetical protein QF873_00355 [Patescibacteria group bacterium]|nr:hypothetical protein [Patescibacteria group bacterium]
MTNQLSDKERATKARLQEIGSKLQASNPTHQASLREQLSEPTPVHVRIQPRKWQWALAPLAGVMAVLVLMVVINERQPQYAMNDFGGNSLNGNVMGTMDSASSLGSETGLSSSSYIPSRPWNKFLNKKDIAEYQDTYGTALEESRRYNVLSKDLDEKTQVQDLFKLYDGSVTNVSDTMNRFTITGTIPQEDIKSFQDRIEKLAAHDKYFSMNNTGQSRTQDLMKAPTDEARQKIQDNVDFVDVVVTLDILPSLWSSSTYDIRRVVAGYEKPALIQTVLIMFIFVLSTAITFFTATFWILIPVGYLIWRRKKSRSTLKFLD